MRRAHRGSGHDHRRPPQPPGDPAGDESRGAHTLRTWEGVVVGTAGDDVFVELGPRMQGVISMRRLGGKPEVGDVFNFTLRGKEESLWALELEDQGVLSTWEEMEPGSLVQGHVRRAVDGGLQLKVGRLHAFLPNSQTGLPREKKPTTLVGKNLTCEVLEVDPERQRIVVSRKAVAQREKQSQSTRSAGHLRPGQVVQGRVTRIEDFGVFLSFGNNLTGMVHVSNLSHERVGHPGELVQMGQTLEAQVLHVRRGGRRIGLGVKQLNESPWRRAEFEHYEGQILEGRVTRSMDFGVFVALGSGIEGLLPNGECGDPRRTAAQLFQRGETVSVRIARLEPDAERMTLSAVHPGGGLISADDTAGSKELERLDSAIKGSLATDLGALLRDALGGRPGRGSESA